MTKATELAHLLVRHHLVQLWHQSALHAIDATVGNGYDTLFLAQCAEERIRILGFDVQDMGQAAQMLSAARVEENVELLQQGHETLLEAAQERGLKDIHVIMFNLGYLPGGDKTLITRPETTLSALRQSVQILASRGILTVVCYRGHDGGDEESDAVIAWAAALPQAEFSVLHSTFINQQGAPPELVAVMKR